MWVHPTANVDTSGLNKFSFSSHGSAVWENVMAVFKVGLSNFTTQIGIEVC